MFLCKWIIDAVIGEPVSIFLHCQVLEMRTMILDTPQTINCSHSDDGTVVSKPRVLCFPVSLQSKVMLSQMIVRVDDIAMFKVFRDDFWSRNLSLRYVAMLVRKSGNVGLGSRHSASSILGHNKTEHLPGIALVANRNQTNTSARASVQLSAFWLTRENHE